MTVEAQSATLYRMTDLPIDDVVATSQEGLREQALQRVKKRREFTPTSSPT